MINTTSTMDSGTYECSVNTLPKISYVVELQVEDTKNMIMHDSPYISTTKRTAMDITNDDDKTEGNIKLKYYYLTPYYQEY